MLAALDCERIELHLDAYVRGALPRDDVHAIDEHLSVCPDCQLIVDQQIVSVCFAPTAPSAPLPFVAAPAVTRQPSPSSTVSLPIIIVAPKIEPAPQPPLVSTLEIPAPAPVAAQETAATPEPNALPRHLPLPLPSPSPSLRDKLLSLPWWVVSAAFHALVIILIGLVSMTIAPPNSDDAVIVVTPLLQQSKVQVEDERRKADTTALLAKNETAPTDPTSKLACDVSVPPDVLATASLRDHFETLNPEGTDTHSAFGNPDAHMFAALHGDDAAAGGGGTQGAEFDALIGAGGGGTRGSGGGFGGGSGTGFGTDSGSGGGCFGQRNGKGRALLIKRHGGSPATEAAVDRALTWLARHQCADGHWDIAKFQGGNTPSGGFANDECIAPLAVLAFLGAGHSPKAGKFKDNVKRGIDWIVSRQAANGSIKFGSGSNDAFGMMMSRSGSAYCYSEALATLAMAEAYGMTNDEHLGQAAQRGINFLASIQESDGGWSHYGCKSTSVVGWVVMAMKSAKIANLKVPPQSFQNALKYLDYVTEKNSDGYYGLSGYGGPKQYAYHQGYTMTAVSMVCYQFMGRGHDTEHQAEILMTAPPAWPKKADFNSKPQNFYHWYYGTLGMFQIGGESWSKWNKALVETLLPHQRTNAHIETPGNIEDLEGSWDPSTTWDPSGGRVYSTAMGALCLEVYYRYVQVDAHK